MTEGSNKEEQVRQGAADQRGGERAHIDTRLTQTQFCRQADRTDLG